MNKELFVCAPFTLASYPRPLPSLYPYPGKPEAWPYLGVVDEAPRRVEHVTRVPEVVVWVGQVPSAHLFEERLKHLVWGMCGDVGVSLSVCVCLTSV